MEEREEKSEKSKKSKKMLSRYLKAVIVVTALIVLGLVPALLSHSFCDWYALNVYGKVCDVITFITEPFPFAVGEIVMFIGAFMAVASVVILILLLFLRKKAAYRKFAVLHFKTFSLGLLIVVFLYVPTWFIPFNGTVLKQGNPELRTSFTYEELYDLLCYIVNGGNAAAEEIAIAEDGSVDFRTEEENRELIAKAMQELGNEFVCLKGHYPPVKAAICSDILDRMNIGGYNYPFTMEPTHNRYINPLYLLTLEAHEYCHHKGYYLENEANFLSVLALSRSEDPYLRLSAFWEMYGYILFDYIDARDQKMDALVASGAVTLPEKLETKEDIEQLKAIYLEHFGPEPEFDERVYRINDAAAEIEWAIYDADSHVIDEMPAVDELISDTATEGWRIQGEILQEKSYDGVTLLLLQYFYK
ncbi:MAG: DUF3810 domain-containing protein [Lachnospiraceae bacterium]|nr:DUF3810 domain-containing protein [Lachnospiraceae bacterium]